MTHEEFTTTFAMDFMIAEAFGKDAVIDTFNRCFNEWKDNYMYGTDLCIVCNALCWQHHAKGNTEYCQMYSEFYYKVRDYCLDNYKGDEFQYFWRMTD